MAEEQAIDATGKSDEQLRQLVLQAMRKCGEHQAKNKGEEKDAVIIRVVNAEHRNNLSMGFDAAATHGFRGQLHLAGPLGDYVSAFNNGEDVRIEGAVGDGVGEGMISGVIRIRGDAGVGAGTAMRGGTLAIYGHAGAFCGAAMQGGELFVRGDVGPAAGAGAVSGTIVIGGNAAEGLGDSMQGSTIFIRGKATMLGRGAREAALREREKLKLGLLLINAGIRGEVKDFRRIVSELTLRADDSRRPKGELNPSWR